MILDLEQKPVQWLIDNIDKLNLAEDLDKDTLQKIGDDVVQMYDFDKASRADWEKKVESGIKIAKQIVEEKSYPWPNAANTKDSLMAEAAAQFAARAGGEVVRGQDVVKVKVTGDDSQGLKEARAKRVGTFMSWDCTDGMEEWESENDQLLTSISLIGMYYKKTFRDPLLGRNVSYSRSPMHVVVHEDAKTLNTAPRITEEMDFSKNKVLERVRAGLWLDITDQMENDDEGMDELFLEQHRTLDLDGDGYEEPYIVTVHKESGAVCRIVARYDESGIVTNSKKEVVRIEALQYFTEFPFLLSPDGKFHKIGWAHLLGPNTETINTIVNQLLDAGHMSIAPPIFMGKGGKLPPGGLKFRPFSVVPVQSTGQALKENLFIPQMTGPSEVLFKLLGLLNEKGQKLANLSESMQGETGGANVPATTTLALLDQALKVYTSILKRLFRAYRQEFQKLYQLDAKYLTDKEYINVVDIKPEELQGIAQKLGVDPAALPEDSHIIVDHDFNGLDKDITPVMDPTASSEAIRLARLNAMAQAAGMPPAVGRIYLEGIGCTQKDINAIFGDPNQPAPPDPKVIELEATITNMKHMAALKERELELKHAEIEQKEAVAVYTIDKLKAEIVNIKASSIKLLADAEAAEVGTQINAYKAEMDQINAEAEQETARIAAQQEGENAKGDADRGNSRPDAGAVEPMAETGNDQEGITVPGGETAGGGQGLDGGELPLGGADLGGRGSLDLDNGGAAAGVQPHVEPTALPEPGPMQ